jgi:PKD repeat protein
MASKIHLFIIYFCLAGVLLISYPVLADETPTPTPTQTYTPINIDFTANVTSGYAPLDILFTDTTQASGEVYFREWFFGDGSSFEDESPEVVHTYTDPGLYTVTFNRRDEHGTHVKIKYDYITVMTPTPTPTLTPTTTITTVPTTNQTTAPTTTPTTAPTTTQTTIPTTIPTTAPTTSPSPTTTSSEPPAEFWGDAIELGVPAPPGSVIIAKISNQERGRITTTVTGQYGGSGAFDERLKVTGSPGDVITFWLNSRRADQTAMYLSGSQNLDLTFTTAPTTKPTTTPTTTPTTGPTTYPTTTPTTSPTTTGTTPTTPPTTIVPTTTQTTVPTTIPTPVPDMYVPLYQGWNFISIPLVLADGYDTGEIFKYIDTDGRITWTYNASLSRWKAISPYTPLEQMEGIWIYSAQFEQFGLHFSKQQGTVNRTFFEGWNALGIPGSDDRSARDALAPVSSSWAYTIGYNGASQEYETTIINGGTGDRSDLRHMFPAKGYWVFFTKNATYEASPTFYL